MKLYNTMTRCKEEFVPRETGKVSIYACGVTPYNYAHIGNARPPVFWDCVRRFLRYRGYEVFYIQNFTDVDDKIIKRSKELGKEPLALADEYAQIYLEDLQALGVLDAELYPKVSEHIPEIVKMVAVLVEKGHAYVLKGDVYYAVESFEEYGKLSGRDLADLQAGARVEVNTAKRNPMDFALWKAAKPGEIAWDSPWGPGRPGWHIECSAMAVKYLGSGFDLHGGGEDLVFPHHENEIAQSESYLGESFARYWLHNAFITVGGERMGKSLGNFATIREAAKCFAPKVIRFWLIGTHYRNPISFGESELQAAAKGLERLETARSNWEFLLQREAEAEELNNPKLLEIEALLSQTETSFVAAMEDDFNTPLALASLYDLVREINKWVQSSDFKVTGTTKGLLRKATERLVELGNILGIFVAADFSCPERTELSDAAVEELIKERTQAKQAKDWPLADRIRNELKCNGIILEDTPQGVRWKQG